MATSRKTPPQQGVSPPEPVATSPERLVELGAALSALSEELEQSSATPPVASGKRPVPQKALARVAAIVERIQVESGTAPLRRLVSPPRLVVPRFDAASDAGGPAPRVIDLGDGGELRMAPQAFSLGLPGFVDINGDDEGVSLGTPFGGVTVDKDGVTLDAGGAGSASVGKDGASVQTGNGSATIGTDGASMTIPGVGTVGVGKDGTVTVEPPANGPTPGAPPPFQYPDVGSTTFQIPVPSFEMKPLAIPISVPTFEVKAVDIAIPIPMPRFVTERFDVPLPVGGLDALALPDLAGLLKDAVAKADGHFKDYVEKLASLVARDPLVDAVRDGLTMWQMQARMKDIKVMGPSAIGSPGCLDGPELLPLLELHAGSAVGHEREFVQATLEGVSQSFRLWADKVMVPGLPWYPAFAAWPGPTAPPTPNIPTPLIACASSDLASITVPKRLETAIRDRLAAAIRPTFETRLLVLAGQLAACFSLWLTQRQVLLVMGQGPVPSFAPPAVPVGPVVGGSAEGMPGCIA